MSAGRGGILPRMPTPAFRALVLPAFLVAAGCGGDPPPLYGDTPVKPGGGGGGGGGPMDCSTPCKCADRGPPDFSREMSGKQSGAGDDQQKAALVRANHWRTTAGLLALDANAKIEQAATAHANFMATNDRNKCWPGAHDENLTCKGATGQWPWDRMEAAGYDWSGASEVINWANDAERAVDEWMWTVYHRQPFMDYGMLETGFGYADGGGKTNNVMDFGIAKGASAKAPEKPAVFPLPGQTQVPLGFSGAESPQPPAPDTGWPSGQIVSLHFPTKTWAVTEHHLFSTAGGMCVEVPHVYIDRTNDDNLKDANDVFFYANMPMTNGTEYVAEVVGTMNGAAFKRTWAFKTQ